METFEKIIRIGTQKEYNTRGQEVDADIFCKIEYRAKKEAGKFELSITGVIGPKSNGDALGGCGQIRMNSMAEIEKIKPAPQWTKAKIKQFMQIWDEWHLNDMNACTPEMKAAGWDKLASKEIFKYSFSMTSDNRKRLEDVRKRCEYAAIKGEVATLTEEEKRLLQSPAYKDVYAYELPAAPEFMEQSMDFYTNYKTPKVEKKTLGWVRVEEHPDGLLGRMLNGKGYGCAWYYEPVPDDVLEWLKALPDTDKTPAWV